MASFTFEQGTQAQADALTPGDVLTFSQALATDVIVSDVPERAAGDARIALTYTGQTLVFRADALDEGTAISFAGGRQLALFTPGVDDVSIFTNASRTIWAFGGGRCHRDRRPGHHQCSWRRRGRPRQGG